MNALSEKIALQLKLQLKVNFAETMAELHLIYKRVEVSEIAELQKWRKSCKPCLNN